MLRFIAIALPFLICACAGHPQSPLAVSGWQLVDDFQSPATRANWTKADVQNDTDPFVKNPQISVYVRQANSNNIFLLRKPAANGLVGNRKALHFAPLPAVVPVGATYTFYTRISVEYFPNNHSFGLSNLTAPEIKEKSYDAFEPMIRVTDKLESNGSKNDGTLMVLSDYKKYSKIKNPTVNKPAMPLEQSTWYEVWYVVNNDTKENGGQVYDLYVRGGEFETRMKVFENAVFRIGREKPLTHFISICNTGPKDKPYGNGGLRYDDIYMAKGVILDTPTK